jgi:hypothetical protein
MPAASVQSERESLALTDNPADYLRDAGLIPAILWNDS